MHRSWNFVPLLVAGAGATSLCEQDDYKVWWEEDFDFYDAGVWTKDVGPPGDSRTRSADAIADAVYVEGGDLVIRTNGTWNGTAWTNLTSGAVTSTPSFKGPARVCVRAQLPGGGGAGRGQGIWPAHWLMPQDDSCWPGPVWRIIPRLEGFGF